MTRSSMRIWLDDENVAIHNAITNYPRVPNSSEHPIINTTSKVIIGTATDAETASDVAHRQCFRETTPHGRIFFSFIG